HQLVADPHKLRLVVGRVVQHRDGPRRIVGDHGASELDADIGVWAGAICVELFFVDLWFFCFALPGLRIAALTFLALDVFAGIWRRGRLWLRKADGAERLR